MDYTLTNLGVGSNKGYNVSYGPNSMLDPKYAVPLGNAVEWVGDKLNLSEGGMSELIAGGPTKHTDPLWKPKKVYAAETAGGNQTVINPNIGPPQNKDVVTNKQVTGKQVTNNPVTNTQQQTGPSQQDIINAYRKMGWNDVDAILADYAATGGSKLGGSSGGGVDANQAAINAARGAFNNAYAPLFAQLDAMAGLIPQQQQQREQGIQNMYGSQVGEIQGARDSAMAGLDVSKQQVAQRQANSVRDLQENLRNMLQAGNIQLGVGGAGDSSAKDMLSFALSKAAARSGADISNQAQAMYTDIDMLGNQIKATYDDNLAKLATWRDNNLSEVTKWAQEMLMNIESQKATAKGQQAAALAANETNIINNALSRLQQIDDQVSSWNKGIQEWALNRMAQIDDAKAKISGYGKYTPGQITAQELQGLGDFSTITNNTLLGYNPWSKQKDEMTNFLSNYGR